MSPATDILPKLTVAQAGTYDTLAIGENGLLMTPGKGVTLIVDGAGVDLERGKTYENVTVAVTEKNMVAYSSTYNFCQGIYAGENGHDESQSVTGTVPGGTA